MSLLNRIINRVFNCSSLRKIEREIQLTGSLLPNGAGRTELHSLAYEGDAAGISASIADGADPSKADADGMTPLHFAVLNDRIDAVGALLKAGADAAATTRDGQTPADMARHRGHGLLAIALEHSAKHQKVVRLAAQSVTPKTDHSRGF